MGKRCEGDVADLAAAREQPLPHDGSLVLWLPFGARVYQLLSVTLGSLMLWRPFGARL